MNALAPAPGDGLVVSTYSAVPDFLDEIPGCCPIIKALVSAFASFAGPGYECNETRAAYCAKAKIGLSSYGKAMRWLKAHGVVVSVPDPAARSRVRVIMLWRRAAHWAATGPEASAPARTHQRPGAREATTSAREATTSARHATSPYSKDPACDQSPNGDNPHNGAVDGGSPDQGRGEPDGIPGTVRGWTDRALASARPQDVEEAAGAIAAMIEAEGPQPWPPNRSGRP